MSSEQLFGERNIVHPSARFEFVVPFSPPHCPSIYSEALASLGLVQVATGTLAVGATLGLAVYQAWTHGARLHARPGSAPGGWELPDPGHRVQIWAGSSLAGGGGGGRAEGGALVWWGRW